MIFKTAKDTKDYPFLHKVATILSKKYPFYDIYMDKQGGLCIDFDKALSETEVKDILHIIHPKGKDYTNVELSPLNYSIKQYTEEPETLVFSEDGFDYRNLI